MTIIERTGRHRSNYSESRTPLNLSSYSESRTPLNLSSVVRLALGILAVSSCLTSALEANLYCSDAPGEHNLEKSPVLGSRRWEVQKIKDSSFLPLFEEFGAGLYLDHSVRSLIEKKDYLKCYKFADQKFIQYITKYVPYNCTSKNIIKKGFNSNVDVIMNTMLIQASPLDSCKLKEECMPYPLIQIHEIMHGEEMPYLVPKMGIIELFTSIKQHILTDEVFKECHNKDRDSEVDYGKTLSIKGTDFSAGEIANIYRDLERTHGSLSSALLSPKSISYLIGDSRYESILEIIQKHPGSKLAAKIAKKCITDANRKVRYIALVVAKDLIQKKQYTQALKIVKIGLKDSNLDLRKSFFGITRDFFEEEEYDSAFEIAMEGLESSDLEIQRDSALIAEDFLEKGKYDLAFKLIIRTLKNIPNSATKRHCVFTASRFIDFEKYTEALEIAIQSLKDPDRSVRDASISLALDFIVQGQFDPACQIVINRLKDPDSQVQSESTIELLELIQTILLSSDISSKKRNTALELLSEIQATKKT